jgi:hypothetical protein
MSNEMGRCRKILPQVDPHVFRRTTPEIFRSVVQSDWLPKYHMETGNDSSAAKDFSGQKNVDYAPVAV